MVLLSILVGGLSILNYYLYLHYEPSEVIILLQMLVQGLLIIINIIILFKYKGKRMVRSFDGGWYKVFTLRFAAIVFSNIGSISILIALFIRQGYLK